MIVGKECFIGIDKSIPMGCIIPASEVVQAGFLIIDIPTIAERIAHTQRIRERAGHGERLTPCIVLVFYNKIAIVVKDANDISLKIMEIGVGRAIEVYLRRTGLRIVKEVQLVSMLNFVKVGVVNLHVRKQLAMISIVRRLRIPAMLQHLLNAHTVVVVLEGERLSVSGHLLNWEPMILAYDHIMSMFCL